MYCGEASVVKAGLDGFRAVSVRCRSWKCPDCAKRRKSQLIALAKSGKPDTFITLTVNPAWGHSPEYRAHKLVDAWRTIIKRVKKQYGYKTIPYFCVFEATKKGEPHLHILCRVKWISQKWLSAQMKSLMGAPIVDIRRVRDKSKLAYYISKYMGKDPHRFETCKRYWTTRDWELEKYEPQEPPGRWGCPWKMKRTPLAELAAAWAADGYEMTVSKNHVLAYAQGPPDDEYWEAMYLLRRRDRGLPW